MEIFSDIYKQLDLNYVDDIKPGQLMKTGIDAMLETLDPYTNYIPESDIEDYKFMTTGQYGGVGASIRKRDEYIVISEPYKGFAADKAGIIAGDWNCPNGCSNGACLPNNFTYEFKTGSNHFH